MDPTDQDPDADPDPQRDPVLRSITISVHSQVPDAQLLCL
jgi:hypothetical protein